MEDHGYLRLLVKSAPTRWWHDLGDPGELDWGLAKGVSGITNRPVLTRQALRPSRLICAGWWGSSRQTWRGTRRSSG